MATTIKDGLLTTEQAAQLAGMSRQALQGHIDAGRIRPAVQAGRLRLFSRETISNWLRDREEKGVAKRGPQPASLRFTKRAKKNGTKRSK